MADNTPGTDGSGEKTDTGDTGAKSDGGAESKTDWEGKYNALQAEHNELREKSQNGLNARRRVTEERDTLKVQLTELQSKVETKSKPSEDIESLKKSAQEQLSQKDSEIAQLQAQNREFTVMGKVKSLASKAGILDWAVEDFCKLQGDKFDLNESGELEVKGSIDKPDYFIANWAKSRPEVLASTRKQGSGVMKPAEGATPQGLTRESFEKLPEAERNKFMNENPTEFMKLYGRGEKK